MSSYKARTIESFNADLASLREQAKSAGVKVYNTLLTFASNNNWSASDESDFRFSRVLADVSDCPDLTAEEYTPNGGTPLLDAIGKGIERLKTELGDDLGSDDVHILVTILTDGEENSSRSYTKDQIKKMIEHFSADGKWTFTFIGCGSIDNVTATSAGLGVSSTNTVAFAATDQGYTSAYTSMRSCRSSYVSAVATNTLSSTKLFDDNK
jgi:Mg-chelatase subunit ChlD